jgi:hypothetical protein
MKRLDLVQITFIVVGICSAFFSLDLIPRFLYYLFAWISSGLTGGYMMESFIEVILSLAAYLIFSIYSIRNSKQLAAWISDKADLHGEINIKIQTRELLFTFFTGLSIYGLIRDLPWLLKNLYYFLSPAADETHGQAATKEQIVVEIIKTGLFIILLVYANVFADFLANRVKNTEPPDEIMEKTD